MLILVSTQTRHTSNPNYYVYISGEINTSLVCVYCFSLFHMATTLTRLTKLLEFTTNWTNRLISPGKYKARRRNDMLARPLFMSIVEVSEFQVSSWEQEIEEDSMVSYMYSFKFLCCLFFQWIWIAKFLR